jgi:hypothetical protein
VFPNKGCAGCVVLLLGGLLGRFRQALLCDQVRTWHGHRLQIALVLMRNTNPASAVMLQRTSGTCAAGGSAGPQTAGHQQPCCWGADQRTPSTHGGSSHQLQLSMCRCCCVYWPQQVAGGRHKSAHAVVTRVRWPAHEWAAPRFDGMNPGGHQECGRRRHRCLNSTVHKASGCPCMAKAARGAVVVPLV